VGQVGQVGQVGKVASANSRRALLRELPAASVPLTVAAAACVVVSAILPVLFAVVGGAAVAAVPEAVAGGFGTPAGRRLLKAVLAVGALLAFQQTLSPFQDAVRSVLARRVQGRTYRRSTVAALRPRTVAHLEDPRLLDLVSAATQLTVGGPAGAVRGVFTQARRILGGGAGLVVVAHFRWWLALLLLAAELWLLRTNRAMYSQIVAFRHRHIPGLRRSVYLRGVGMNAEAAKETRVFGLAGWVVERFRSSWLATMADVWRGRRGYGRRLLLAASPLLAVQLLAGWMLGTSAVDGTISLGAMVAYASALATTLQLCLGGDELSIEEGAAVVKAAHELERTVATDERLRMPGTQTPPEGAPTSEIRLEGVSFSYPGRPEDVLHDLDLTIPASGSLAIVGENGAGKTTLVKLLARLYDPTAGRILVDGTDLREFDAAGWQRRVTAVFQDFVRYPLTAAENVAFGDPAAPSTDLDLDLAARREAALDLVERLPKGWDTVLTREFEGGVDLSGGEWQRIALARALYAAQTRGAGVLILDEPTAHLDARAEAAFIDGFLEVTRGCTTIVVSHRFSTVRRAERIAVLDGGRVTELGTHDELLAARGRYAEMFELQAGRFADA
jgi:ATP-binding cassette subfamily B protein